MLQHLGIRERTEAREKALSPYARQSAQSRGRLRPEAPDPVRTAFQRDRDRILHTNAYRRLKHKTQVFIAPLGDHYVTRLTHTLEVSQLARTIARALLLNEDLSVEAMHLGHDTWA
jgi:dGTPase